MPIRLTGRGKGSGIPVEGQIVHAWKIRGEKAVELRIYSTVEEAFEALALRP